MFSYAMLVTIMAATIACAAGLQGALYARDRSDPHHLIYLLGFAAIGGLDVLSLVFEIRSPFLTFLLIATFVTVLVVSFQSLRRVGEDLTAADTLLAERMRQEHILGSLEEVYFEADRAGCILDISPRVLALLGREPRELIGGTLDGHLADRSKGTNPLANLDPSPGSLQCDLDLLDRKGHTHTCRLRARLVGVEGEGRLYGTITDITKHRATEATLLASRNEYRDLFENTPDAIVLCDRETLRIERVNLAAVRLFGHSRAQFMGLGAAHLTTQPDLLRTVVEKVGTDDPVHRHAVLTHVKRNGDHFPAELSSTLWWSGEQIKVLITIRDASERQRLQEQFAHRRKLESIGTLAAGVAHDMNNILTPIIGYAEISQKEAGSTNENLAFYLKKILKASHRARDLVRQLRHDSKRDGERWHSVSLPHVVGEAVGLLRASLPDTIDIVERYDAEDLSLLGNPEELRQVVTNICANASRAIADGHGTIDISIDALPQSQHPASTTGSDARDHLRLTVRDTGEGMPPEVLRRAFDPYFTTRESDVGSGLGLFVVHNIVTDHGGHVAVESVPRRGTTVTVYLPVSPRENRKQTPETVAGPGTPGGTELILLVDDNPGVAEIQGKLLKRLGYEVEVIDNGPEALATFRSNPARYDLVITDQSMPDMTGTELCRHLRGIRGDARVLLCTGLNDAVDDDAVRNAGALGCLQKPIAFTALAHSVRSALDRAA